MEWKSGKVSSFCRRVNLGDWTWNDFVALSIVLCSVRACGRVPRVPMNFRIFFLLLVAGTALAQKPEPLVIAHRGASGYLPEHTLEAKALAHGMGAHFIEQDIVLSRDGVPLVLHDIEIDTVTDVAQRFPGRQRANGHFYAIDFTWAEIRQLRVTERFDPETGRAVYPRRFPLWKSSFVVSTLEEELELIEGLNRSTGRRVGVYPEIKSPGWHRRQGQDISTLVLQVLARHGYATREDPFFLQCFEFDEVKRIRTELGFKGRLVQLVGRHGGGEIDATGVGTIRDNTSLLTRAGLGEVARVADGIGPAYGQILSAGPDGVVEVSEVVRYAHEFKLVVHPYTFRADALPGFAASEEAFLELLFRRAGVDGLFTDHPDRVLAYLRSSGSQSAQPAMRSNP